MSEDPKHEDTAEYWKSMYKEQLRRKRVAQEVLRSPSKAVKELVRAMDAASGIRAHRAGCECFAVVCTDLRNALTAVCEEMKGGNDGNSSV